MRKIVIVLGFFCLILGFSYGRTVAQIAGDANGDSAVNAADVVYQINYLFINGPPPIFYECGDPNVDCQINSADVAYLINYLFIGGPSPQIVECGWSEPVNLGLPINSPNGEESFRMTPDGRMAVWASNRPGTYGNHDIWYSFWDTVSGSWSEPQNCGPNVNTMIEDLGPCLSPDGKKLYYIQFERPGGYGSWDIWVSTWDSVNNEWGVPENLGPTINTDLAEWSPFVSPDGSKLYFSNNWGIWVSEWNGSGWDTPVLLNFTVNSNLDEKHPSVTADNKTLYFTRDWFTYCIWVSHWTGTGWGSAMLLPPQINDPGGAGESYITPYGSKLYFISARSGGVGSGDIWMSEKIPIGKRECPKGGK
jgi:Tol biopolymer transport system component